MLIDCLECKREISDQAISCPYCGCPITKTNDDLYKVVLQNVGDNFGQCVVFMRDVLKINAHEAFEKASPMSVIIDSINKEEAESIVKQFTEIGSEAVVMPNNQSLQSMKQAAIEPNPQPQQNIPKCPTCQSTDLKKISATSKAANVAMFGIFGNKRKKTFHCNNCKYEW